MDTGRISIKSKYDVEYRRYALRFADVQNFDPDDQDSYLPINNDDNLAKAISTAQSISRGRLFLKLMIAKKEVILHYYNGKNGKKNQPSRPSIGMPEDFRQVSSIIDVDIVPETCRRVRLVKHGSDRPLGFYIRDGFYSRSNAQGQLERVNGIFISRLIPGGLAESTGLLAVNDEVLEVNGIEVTHGKTLDQVTDMMVANSSNLIITIRPANYYAAQNNRMYQQNQYQNSYATGTVMHNIHPPNKNDPSNGEDNSNVSDHDEDEIKDHLNSDSYY